MSVMAATILAHHSCRACARRKKSSRRDRFAAGWHLWARIVANVGPIGRVRCGGSPPWPLRPVGGHTFRIKARDEAPSPLPHRSSLPRHLPGIDEHPLAREGNRKTSSSWFGRLVNRGRLLQGTDTTTQSRGEVPRSSIMLLRSDPLAHHTCIWVVD